MRELDFRRFMKHMKEYCSKVTTCAGCILCEPRKGVLKAQHPCPASPGVPNFDIEEFIKIADEWCREHPIKSYQRDFFEKFPKAEEVYFTRQFCRNKVYGLGVCRYEGRAVKYCEMCWSESMDEESGNADESKTE